MVAMGDTFQAGELGLEVAPNSGNSTDLPTHMHAHAHTHKHTHALSNTSHSPYTYQYIQLTHHVCNHTIYKLTLHRSQQTPNTYHMLPTGQCWNRVSGNTAVLGLTVLTGLGVGSTSRCELAPNIPRLLGPHPTASSEASRSSLDSGCLHHFRCSSTAM